MESRRVYREVEVRSRLNKEFSSAFYHSWITNKLLEDLNEYKDAFKIKAVGALLMTVWASTNKGKEQILAANSSTKSFFKAVPYISEENKEHSGADSGSTNETQDKDTKAKIDNPGKYLMEKFLKSRGTEKTG